MNHYETVFILNPVLSETQIEETVKKFEDFLIKNGAKMVSKEDWGLKKLTSSTVKEYFGTMVKGQVERYELPNLYALNFFEKISFEKENSSAFNISRKSR